MSTEDQGPGPEDQNDLTEREESKERSTQVDAAASEEPEGEAPPAPTPPASAPAGASQGGGEVIRLGSAPESTAAPSEGPTFGRPPQRPTNASDFPGLVQRVYAEAGAAETGKSYGDLVRQFLSWCSARGLDVGNMPSDTCLRWLEQSYPAASTRNHVGSAMRAAFDIAVTRGVAIARQEIPRNLFPKRAKPASEAAPTQRVQRGMSTSQPSQTPTVPRTEEPHPQAPQPAVSQAARETQRVGAAQPRATPVGAKRGTSAVPPLGGRIRVYKRIDGTEGLPSHLPVGSVVVIGTYGLADLDGEGRIEDFIANRLRPIYGPFQGEPATTYMVDRLDNLGNPIPGASLEVPVMPLDTPRPAVRGGGSPPYLPMQPQQGQPGGAPTPTPLGSTTDLGGKFIEYLMAQQQRAESKAEEALRQMREAASSRGMDPALVMLMAERLRPEPIDIAKAASEFRRAYGIEEEPLPPPMPPRRHQSAYGGGGGLGGAYGGGLGGLDDLGGLDGVPPAPVAAQPPARDPLIEVLGSMLREQSTMLRELLIAKQGNGAPAPTPQAQMGDMLNLMQSLANAMRPQKSELESQVMQAAVSRLLAPPEKPRGTSELLKELRDLQAAREILEGAGQDKPLGLGDIAMAAVENLPTIMQAVASARAIQPPKLAVIADRRGSGLRGPAAAAMPPPAGTVTRARHANGHANGRANGQANSQTNGHATPTAPQGVVLPDEARKQFLVLKDSTDDQQIADAIFAILGTYMQAPDPWPLCAKRLIDGFNAADSRTELQAVVTNLFVWAGAKRVMTAENVERITDVLFRYYTPIYAQINNGREKHLADATQSIPVETSTPQEVAAAEREHRASPPRDDGEDVQPTNGMEEVPSPEGDDHPPLVS